MQTSANTIGGSFGRSFFTRSTGATEERFDLAELFAKNLFGRHWIALSPPRTTGQSEKIAFERLQISAPGSRLANPC